MAKIELAQLLEAGVHFGHKAHRWNPKMFPYIYTERDGVHILDLIQTAELLKQACDFAQAASEEGKTFLFVGTKRQAASVDLILDPGRGDFFLKDGNEMFDTTIHVRGLEDVLLEVRA